MSSKPPYINEQSSSSYNLPPSPRPQQDYQPTQPPRQQQGYNPNIPQPRTSALCYDSEEDRRLVENSLVKLLWVLIISVVAVGAYLLIIYIIKGVIDFGNSDVLVLFIIAVVGLVASMIIVIIIYSNHRSIPSCSRAPLY